RQQGPLPIDLACSLMYQTAQAMQYAHEQGMVHRDIKPANLLITQMASPTGQALADGAEAPTVKVLDFGLARLQKGESAGQAGALEVEAGGLIGTPDYISPEHIHDVHHVDIRSDLYSLGCTFFYALTGRVPYPGSAVMEKLTKHLLIDAEPVDQL